LALISNEDELTGGEKELLATVAADDDVDTVAAAVADDFPEGKEDGDDDRAVE
jgi:hypothetical protein